MDTRLAKLLIAAALVGAACGSRSDLIDETRKSPRIPSPSGWCEAYISEIDLGPNAQTTQVMLSFDGGQTAAGAVSAQGMNLGLALRWLDATTLQVQHSKGVHLEYGPSGDVLQSFGRKVKVVLSEE